MLFNKSNFGNNPGLVLVTNVIFFFPFVVPGARFWVLSPSLLRDSEGKLAHQDCN